VNSHCCSEASFWYSQHFLTTADDLLTKLYWLIDCGVYWLLRRCGATENHAKCSRNDHNYDPLLFVLYFSLPPSLSFSVSPFEGRQFSRRLASWHALPSHPRLANKSQQVILQFKPGLLPKIPSLVSSGRMVSIPTKPGSQRRACIAYS